MIMVVHKRIAAWYLAHSASKATASAIQNFPQFESAITQETRYAILKKTREGKIIISQATKGEILEYTCQASEDNLLIAIVLI
jgi:hypothetical protein